MYRRFESWALRWARVSPEPAPPIGAPGSIRIFRAGRNHYYIRLLRWGAGQYGATIGLVISLTFALAFESYFERAVAALKAPAPTASPGRAPNPSAAAGAPVVVPPLAPRPGPSPSPAATPRRSRNRSATQVLTLALSRTPQWILDLAVNWFVPFLMFLEYLGVVTFLVQLPFTYALVRIEFEQHWYIVTDRSLRIRTGVLSVSESTMSFANLQQVEVKQGPIQGLLGLADVRVRSAGGGNSSHEPGQDALHTGSFHNVENANEIRDLIVERLRAFREAGLGDPDHGEKATNTGPTLLPAETLDAAREMLREARALRAVSFATRSS